MGKLDDLSQQAADAERRVVDGQQRVKARALHLRDSFSERYLVGTLVVAGVAAGIALHQYLRIRSATAPRRKARRKGRGGSALRSLAQFVIASLLAQRSRQPRRPPAEPEIAAPPASQSIRSTSRADASSARSGNGLLRH